jgi:hypothetical protein
VRNFQVRRQLANQAQITLQYFFQVNEPWM